MLKWENLRIEFNNESFHRSHCNGVNNSMPAKVGQQFFPLVLRAPFGRERTTSF